MILAPLFLFFAPPPAVTAEDVMARVAENQDRAQKMRSAFVYRQNVLVRLKHLNGKLANEEESEYIVTPDEKSTKKERVRFLGKYVSHGKVVEYREPRPHRVHVSMQDEMDDDLTHDLADDFGLDKKSKDGLSRNLFPLTVDEQRHYRFHLDGTEDYRGTPVYRILFEPNDKYGERPWEGEALIDQKEYQPVLVTTRLTFKIPTAVKVVLGTNIEHLGFKVAYRKFDEGLWFPVTYGGEMKVRALFFYARRIGISVRNSDFSRAQVTTQVKYDPVP